MDNRKGVAVHHVKGSSLAGILVFICLGCVLLAFIGPCVSGPSRSSRTVQRDVYNVQVAQLDPAADGLDLQAVGQLVKNAKDGEDLERMINTADINNIDLNSDGNVDYIKVEEYGAGDNRGFSLYTEFEAGEEQEIATIDIAKDETEEHEIEIHGNQHVYGQNHYYRSRFGVGDAILLGWLFSSHRPYYSPWGYGSYPGYYRNYAHVPTGSYRSRVSSRASGSGFTSASSSSIANKAASPKSTANSSKIKAPLKNPTASQRSFQARSTSRAAGKGGFGRRTSTSPRSSSSSSVRRSSSSRSSGRSGGK